jgi:DMSO/TMAO reductase YedYZ molybdopterin-dependent catalytic subunit
MSDESPRRRFVQLAAVAVLAGLSSVAGSYAVSGYTPSFVVAPIDALVVAMTPGAIVTFVIENIGSEGHLLHIALSLGLAVGLFGVIGLAGYQTIERSGSRLAGGVVSGVLAWAAAAVITAEPLLAAGAAVPIAVFVPASRPGPSTSVFDASRRRALGTVGTVLGFAGVAAGTGTVLSQGSTLESVPNAGVAEQLQTASDRSLDIHSNDLHGLISEANEFYTTDIAEFDPELSADDWSMTITGETNADDLTVTYDDLTEMPSENRFITLRCVGERINGRKLDTAVWTGTPMEPLLDEVDPDSDCDCVLLHGDDDYFVRFPTEVLRTGFLVWGMNGRELPQAHGHPVRIMIPGHWGETNVKWLTEIELLDEEVDGYWERRGWQGTGTVTTVTKLWDEGISHLDDGRIELAGHAYAGLRGVQGVEVSTDGGDTWTDATLSDPLPGDDVWRQWRHRFQPDGTHEVVVRAIDESGNVQTQEPSDPAPTGATGWVRRTVEG